MSYDAWLHGPRSMLLGLILVAGGSLIGLQRANAPTRAYVLWPVTSVITFVATVIVMTIVQELFSALFNASWENVPGMVLATMLFLLGGFLGGLYWGTGPRLGATHRRGAQILERGDSPASKPKSQSDPAPAAAEPLKIGGIAIPFEDETKHFKLMGTTGAGKSTAMRELLHGALKRGDRAVIADPDGGYLARFYNPERGDVILNPFDARSARWDLFAELLNPYDIDLMARALIPDKPKADATWTSYGRTLFSAIVGQVKECGQGTAELNRLVTTAKWEELRLLLAGTAASNFLEEANARMFGSILGTLTDHLQALKYVSVQQGAAFSVREWIKSGRGVLFLPYQADQIPALRPIISVWMRLAIVQTLSLGEGDARLWFLVDEMDALGPIDGMSDALPRLRKFGGRCGLGFQAISQMGTTYGEGLAHTLVENCGTSLILRCSASENGGTSGFASRLIGEREVIRTVKSSSSSSPGLFSKGGGSTTHGSSEQHATEYAVLPAEIEQLPDLSGFLKFPSQPAWQKVSFPYFDVPKTAEAFVPIRSNKGPSL